MGDSRLLDVDYLVIGAGAGGMAFVDELLPHTEATVAMVDRRHAPGGHWQDAYPFVRLHQPSVFYGVSSEPMGKDCIDIAGPNAGYYELAGADEIRAYYERVMHRRFLASGRVQYFPSCEWDGADGFQSRLTGARWRARVRRKVVDAGYLEGTVPATCPPPFEVAEGVKCVPLGALVSLAERPERYAIIGGGKTALDACGWLLEQGVSPSAITWVRPREAWWLNRKFSQPLTLLPQYYQGVAIQLEAMARATSLDELFTLLEAEGVFLRLDRDVVPTMFRGALVSEGELERLRKIQSVIRLGHVRRIERDAIILEGGRVPTDAGTVHVHCAAKGLAQRPLRPIFEPGRVTVQPILWGFACYQSAMLGVVEALVEGDDEKNRLCPPIRYWENNDDYPSAFLATILGNQLRAEHAGLRDWVKKTRLNPAGGIGALKADPAIQATRARIDRAGMAAAMNLSQLLGRA